MIGIILRRSSSIASRCRFAAFISSVESVLSHHQLSPSTAGNGGVGLDNGSFSILLGRAFHSKYGPLNFRSSLVSNAEFAVQDYSYEEGPKGNSDEGLEIAKLGIAQEIVSALAKRGISKLFPIQVSYDMLDSHKKAQIQWTVTISLLIPSYCHNKLYVWIVWHFSVPILRCTIVSGNVKGIVLCDLQMLLTSSFS